VLFQVRGKRKKRSKAACAPGGRRAPDLDHSCLERGGRGKKGGEKGGGSLIPYSLIEGAKWERKKGSQAGIFYRVPAFGTRWRISISLGGGGERGERKKATLLIPLEKKLGVLVRYVTGQFQKKGGVAFPMRGGFGLTRFLFGLEIGERKGEKSLPCSLFDAKGGGGERDGAVE